MPINTPSEVIASSNYDPSSNTADRNSSAAPWVAGMAARLEEVPHGSYCLASAPHTPSPLGPQPWCLRSPPQTHDHSLIFRLKILILLLKVERIFVKSNKFHTVLSK